MSALNQASVSKSGQSESIDVPHAVVTATAECLDVDPLDLDRPLQSAVDTDALDGLWGSDTEAECTLSFEYCGCHVTVRKDGSVDAVRL